MPTIDRGMGEGAWTSHTFDELTEPVCRFDKNQHIRDEISGLYFCPRCDNILSHLPPGRMYMLLGSSGVGKSVFLYKLVDLYLRNQRPCIFVTFDEQPADVRTSMKSFVRGLEVFEEKGMMSFVDCYSCLAGAPSHEKFSISVAGDVNQLNLKIVDILKTQPSGRGPTIFLDSATNMSFQTTAEATSKFLFSLGARVKPNNGSLFFTIGLGAVPVEFQRRLEQMADGLIEFKAEQETGRPKRYYRISKVRGTMYFDAWLPFFVGKENIFLGPPEDEASRERFERVFSLIVG